MKISVLYQILWSGSGNNFVYYYIWNNVFVSLRKYKALVARRDVIGNF